MVIAALFSGWASARLVAGLLGTTTDPLLSCPPAHPRAAIRAGAQGWLNRAGLGLTVERFAAATGLLAAMSGLVIWLVTSAPGLALVGGAVAAGGPTAVHDRRSRSRARARVEAWPDALRDLATNLRAPMSLHDALIELTVSGPEELRPVFGRYQSVSVTLDPAAALEMAREELADPVSDRIIEILLVALEQGSAVVVDILLDLAESTGADLRLLTDLETAQLETRVEARVAAVLPFAVLALLIGRSPEYRAFYASRFGTLVILAGGVLVLVGLWLIARLGRSVPEERVLAQGSPS
ncbi:MAG: hypothetical protein GY929_21955 [Actinomycetia bacterium]|nr:hypothetical protein [Actinomycetes bacterium]